MLGHSTDCLLRVHNAVATNVVSLCSCHMVPTNSANHTEPSSAECCCAFWQEINVDLNYFYQWVAFCCLKMHSRSVCYYEFELLNGGHKCEPTVYHSSRSLHVTVFISQITFYWLNFKQRQTAML